MNNKSAEYSRIIDMIRQEVGMTSGQSTVNIDAKDVEDLAYRLLTYQHMAPRVRAVADALREVAGPASTPEDLAQIAVDAITEFDAEQQGSPTFNARPPQIPHPDYPPGSPSVSFDEVRNVLSLARQFTESVINRQTGCTIKDADRIAAKTLFRRLIVVLNVFDEIQRQHNKTGRLREAYGG